MTTPATPTPTPATYRVEDLAEIDRHKISINPSTGCWEWTASIRPDGYGAVKRSGRVLKAHRYVYETLVGPLGPNGHQLDHRCRVRHCVNPAHIEPVTPLENVRRGVPAIEVELPDDLLRDVLRLTQRAYKRGVYDGLRQALGRPE